MWISSSENWDIKISLENKNIDFLRKTKGTETSKYLKEKNQSRFC